MGSHLYVDRPGGVAALVDAMGEYDYNNMELLRLLLSQGAEADVVWVGLVTPKQEHWMREHRDALSARVMVGVGAAFEIYSGGTRQAPARMRERGLEWFFRLLQELRRLWRRYLLYGTEFVFWITMDLLGLRRFE